MSAGLLEICCDSTESAVAAAAGGADRLELCVDLPADGLTPSIGLLKEVKALVSIPVFVLVRCRPGDFVFSEKEVVAMCQEIVELREAGADGIVCGALTAEDRIDEAALIKFQSFGQGLPFTFHKAFDVCDDLDGSMQMLVARKVDRVLTSGGERFAVDAVETLARLAETGGATTQVLCAGGVRSANLAELIQIPGVSEFHSAARATVSDPVEADEVRRLKSLLSR